MCECRHCEATHAQGPGPYCPRCGIRFAFTNMTRLRTMDLCPPCDAALTAECRTKPVASIARLRARYAAIRPGGGVL